MRGERVLRSERAAPQRVVHGDQRLKPGRTLRIYQVHVGEMAEVEQRATTISTLRVGRLSENVEARDVRLTDPREELAVLLVGDRSDGDALLQGARTRAHRGRCG